MRTLFLAVVTALLAATWPATADEAGDYQALVAASKLKDHARTLELALGFRAAYPTSGRTPEVTFLAGRMAQQVAQHARAVELYDALLSAYPQHAQADVARSQLLRALDKERRLEEMIERAAGFARDRPSSSQRDYWSYVHADSLFRLWRFAEAEPALLAAKTQSPTSTYLPSIDRDLAWINPKLEADANGQLSYRGKYVSDARFTHLQAALPTFLGEARTTLKATLGIDIGAGRVAFVEWVDSIGDAGVSRAVTNTLCHEGKPASIISFATEHAVVSAEGFRFRLTHELKHAHFRNAMGQAYLGLPRWVREGLAVHCARQTPGRLVGILVNQVFSGRPPAALLNGLEGDTHGVDDYLEDALAFDWLATRGVDAVPRFAQALLAGTGYRNAFADAAGMDYGDAISAARVHAQSTLDRTLGPPLATLEELNVAGAVADTARRDTWFQREGKAAYEAWLTQHPDHALASVARYKLGKLLILTGRYDEGREQLRIVFERDVAHVTIADDALYWYARAFERQGDAARAAAAYGALMRDYSWCRYAKELAGKRTPGAPLTTRPEPGDPVR